MQTFRYDRRKAAANLRKPTVSFEEAITSFFDQNAISGSDVEHSQPGDERLINIGMSNKERLLFVVHNEDDEGIRIISARLASPAQRTLYEEG